jgi:hypothetical protein
MDPLACQIADFIQGPSDPSEDAFNSLACSLFGRQYALNAPYRRLCDSDGTTPAHVSRWQDIPAVPAQAFKTFTLSCVPSEQIDAEFHSSGTTGPQTSRHLFDRDALDLYEISLRHGYEIGLPTAPPLLWAMMPSPEDAPHSSLSHMLGALEAGRFFWDDDAALADALAGAALPLTLFGTAFAFVSLFDGSNALWRLPVGSRVIETGGFKGRTREVPRDELYDLFVSRLGVPIAHCYSEYGMSEMASQFYGRGLDPVKRGPHWVRTRAIDPITGTDIAPGEPGVLRHYDLANFNSVLALQTQDQGTPTDNGFVLHGRATDAEVRGCSLTVEELWQAW